MIRLWPHKKRAKFIGLTIAVLIVGLVAAYSILIGIRARSLSGDLLLIGDAIGELDIDQVDSDDSDIAKSLDELLIRADALDRDFWPFRLGARLFGIVPVLGDSLAIGPNVTQRMVLDIEATILLLGAADDLFALVDGVGGGDGTIQEILSQLPGRTLLDEPGLRLSDATGKLERSQQLASEVTLSRIPSPLHGNLRDLERREAQLLGVVVWTGLAVDSLKALSDVGTAAAPVSGLFASSDGQIVTLSSSFEDIAVLSANLLIAAELLELVNNTVPVELSGTRIDAEFGDLWIIVGALLGTVQAVEQVVDAIDPAVGQLAGSDGGLFGPGSNLISSIESLAESDAILAKAEISLQQAAESLRSREFGRPSIGTAAEELRSGAISIAAMVGLLRNSHQLAPGALGKDSVRRYLLLGLTADELRGSGGFLSAVWLITIRNGQIVENRYYDVVKIDSRHDLAKYPSPPALLREHMDIRTWLTRDVAWDPDFPSVAERMTEFWGNGDGREAIDGVIAINQLALVKLIEALVSIEVDGNQITGQLAMRDIESGTDDEGREYTNKIFQAIQQKVMSPLTRSGALRLAFAFGEMLERKDMMLNFFDPEMQEVAASAGWSGTINFGEGDRLAIVDSNVGWNKVDRNIVRNTEYSVTLAEAGYSTTSTTVSYRNLSGPDAVSCATQKRILDASYSDLLQACYWNTLRAYLPAGAKLIGSSSLLLPENSIAHLTGAGLAGQNSVDISLDSGGAFLSGLLVVPPGETRSFTYETEVMDLISPGDGSTAKYVLNVFAQAGVRERNTVINVVLPPGYIFKGSSLRPTSRDEQSIRFEFPLVSDTTIVIEMIKR